MALSLQETGRIRDRLFLLDPDSCQEDAVTYSRERLRYIKCLEGVVPRAYVDCLGLTTIGIGFNMDREHARQEWNLAFQSKERAPRFDEVYAGRVELGEEDIECLAQVGLSLREDQLKSSYGEIWFGLKPNERLATESLYFNHPSLAQGPDHAFSSRLPHHHSRLTSVRSHPTRYYSYLKQYVETRSEVFLRRAVEEVRERSNRLKLRGIDLRRQSEACMLASYDIPGF